VTRFRLGLLALAALLAARPAAAQDSVFGIRGLGFLGQPISAHSAAMGGGESMFDGSSAVSPASLAAWRGLAGWAVGAQSQHTFNPGTGAVSLSSMRFPMFGFAAPVGNRLVIGVDVSDYLNRNWDVQRTDTVMPRDTALPVTDRTRSLGGVTDLRFAAAYRVSSRIALGVGLHVLTGSVQTAVERDFPTDSTYHTFGQVTETDYRGLGVSLGLFVTPIERVVVGASARFNGRLSENNPGGNASVRLPTELAGGLYVTPWDGVMVATTVIHDNWSVAASRLEAAGQPPSRDVWSVGVGAEITLLKLFGEVTPLRAGYRWRQLPFPVDTAVFLSEHAVSGGLSFTLAGGRASVDFAVEGGSRAAGALKESFTTVLVGLSIFP
jgi:long-subunit fatty acid transport protein